MKTKKDLDKEMEKLEAMGQENEKKSIPSVREIMAEEEKKIEEKKARNIDVLEKKRNFSFRTYNMALSDLLVKRMSLVDFPDGWKYGVTPTDEGVVLTMTYGDRVFRAGFKPTGEAKYDLNAVNMYAVRAENTIDRIMNKNPHVGNI